MIISLDRLTGGGGGGLTEKIPSYITLFCIILHYLDMASNKENKESSTKFDGVILNHLA